MPMISDVVVSKPIRWVIKIAKPTDWEQYQGGGNHRDPSQAFNDADVHTKSDNEEQKCDTNLAEAFECFFCGRSVE